MAKRRFLRLNRLRVQIQKYKLSIEHQLKMARSDNNEAVSDKFLSELVTMHATLLACTAF